MSTPDGENPVKYVMERDSSEIKATPSQHCARHVRFLTIEEVITAIKKGRPLGRPFTETLSLISLSNRP